MRTTKPARPGEEGSPPFWRAFFLLEDLVALLPLWTALAPHPLRRD